MYHIISIQLLCFFVITALLVETMYHIVSINIRTEAGTASLQQQ